MKATHTRGSLAAMLLMVVMTHANDTTHPYLRRRHRHLNETATLAPLAPAPFFFSDSFDTYPLGPFPTPLTTHTDDDHWITTTTSKGATVTVANFDKQNEGDMAIKCTTPGGEGGKTAYLTFTGLADKMAAAAGVEEEELVLYGRFRFFLESAPTVHDVHWSFVQGTGLVKGVEEEYRAALRFAGQVAIDVGGEGEGRGSQLMANYDTPDFYGGKGPGTDCWVQGKGATMPTNKWVCAEFALDGRGENVGMQLWLDGVEVSALHVDPAKGWHGDMCVHQEAATYEWKAPVVDRLDLGWESYNKDEEERVMWVDDVALGAIDRLGC